MRESIFLGLVNNAALLLALWAIYTLVSLRSNLRSSWEKVISGIAIGVLGIAVMFTTLPFSPGVVFDTRSILLSIAGLYFGPIPALIAAVMTSIFRYWQGGMGIIMGITVIVSSTMIGLAWRYLRRNHERASSWIELYLLGIVVHIVMLLAAFTLPREVTLNVLRDVSLPVMLIYPLATVGLGVLFSNQLTRKKLSQELEKSEVKYRNIVETAEEGICSLDQDKNYVFFNRKFATMLGYRFDELMAHPFDSLLSAPSKEIIEEKRKNRRNGIHENYDLQMIGRAGNLLWVNVSAVPIYDTDGQYSGALAMYTDITDRVRLQEELRKSEEYFRILFQQSPLPYQSLDEMGCFNDVNQVWLESLGYTKEEVIGKWFGDFLSDDEKHHFSDRYLQFKQDGEIHDVEFKMQRKDGEIIFVSFDGRIGKSEQNVFDQAYCVWRDVSQIHRAQKALTESEARFRTAFLTSPDAIDITRLSDGLLVEINDGFTAITGYTREETIGRTLGEINIWEHREDREKLVQVLKKKGELTNLEGNFRMKDGRFITGLISARIILLDDVPHILSMMRNIEKIKQTENALRESEEKLRALANYLQTAIETDRAHIAREIHDELGQLMTGLKLDLAWCRRNSEKYQLLSDRYASMDILVDDAIRISRRLTSELRPGLLDDLGLIPAMEWYVGEFRRRSDIECTVEFPENEPMLDQAMKTTVYRILQEALTNIARHADAGHAHIQLSFDDYKLRLEVHDDGRGITPQELNNSRSLGLLGIQERARQSGGSVEISGKSGYGTSVIAWFPLSLNTHQEISL